MILCQAFGPSFLGLIVFHLPLYEVFHFCVFFIQVSFISESFSRHPFFLLLFGATQTVPDGLSSCASHSDSQISLSYSMAVFSTKSFRLFLSRFVQIQIVLHGILMRLTQRLWLELIVLTPHLMLTHQLTILLLKVLPILAAQILFIINTVDMLSTQMIVIPQA